MNFVVAAFASLSRRQWLRALALALGPASAWVISHSSEPENDLLNWKIYTVAQPTLSALLILAAVLCAHEAVRRGMKIGVAHLLAWLMSLLPLLLIDDFLHRIVWNWLAPPGQRLVGLKLDPALLMAVILCGVALVACAHRLITVRMFERLRENELHRAWLRQQATEARIAATEEQVDPRQLLASLADIRDAVKNGAPEAERLLEQLVQSMRAALNRIASARHASRDDLR